MVCLSWPTQPRAFSNQIGCADYEYIVFFANNCIRSIPCRLAFLIWHVKSSEVLRYQKIISPVIYISMISTDWYSSWSEWMYISRVSWVKLVLIVEKSQSAFYIHFWPWIGPYFLRDGWIFYSGLRRTIFHEQWA